MSVCIGHRLCGNTSFRSMFLAALPPTQLGTPTNPNPKLQPLVCVLLLGTVADPTQVPASSIGLASGHPYGPNLKPQPPAVVWPLGTPTNPNPKLQPLVCVLLLGTVADPTQVPASSIGLASGHPYGPNLKPQPPAVVWPLGTPTNPNPKLQPLVCVLLLGTVADPTQVPASSIGLASGHPYGRNLKPQPPAVVWPLGTPKNPNPKLQPPAFVLPLDPDVRRDSQREAPPCEELAWKSRVPT
jgi:hypothetical protein